MASAADLPFFIDKNALPVMKSEHRISSLGHAIRAGVPCRALRIILEAPARVRPQDRSRNPLRPLRGGKALRRAPKTPRRRNSSPLPAPFGVEIFRSNTEFHEGPVGDPPALFPPREPGTGPEILRDLTQIDFIREIAYET